jgi:trigger factor
MQISKQQIDATSVKLDINAAGSELSSIKQAAIDRLGEHVKVPGFRPGKAPAALVEKQLNPNRLQTEFLEQAVNQLFVAAVEEQKLRPVSQPKISITKFVPFDSLSFTIEMSVVGDIVLANYRQFRLKPSKPTVTAADVNEVLKRLQERSAKRTQVKRPAQLNDEVVIDFKGADAITKEPIGGASSTNYTLLLGSQSFIPGFEESLIGLKAGDSKDVLLTFPKDYGVRELQGRKVNFAVNVKTVSELVLPKLDDSFASNIGPFEKLTQAKEVIKRDIITERTREAQSAYDNQLVSRLVEKSTIAVPQTLIEEEVDRIEEEEKRNLSYQGVSWQQHLKQEGVSAEEHRQRQFLRAEQRVKAGLVLSEVAQQEKITVTPEELEVRVMLLKNQYKDEAMLAELDKPDNRRDIQTRLLTEKTLDKLKEYATKKAK